MDTSSSPAAVVSVRPDKIPRARPVIELNLNVEEAMIEAVDLLRSIRVQLEGITGTVNDRLNRTFSDAGEDLTKIIHNVESMSSNLAVSTGQLYQPVLFSLLFLLIFLILMAIFLFIVCRIRKDFNGRRNGQKMKKKSKSKSMEEKAMEEGNPLMEEGGGGDEAEEGQRAKRRRQPHPFGRWLRRFRRRRSNNGHQAGSARPSPELEELREKMPMQKGSVGEYHESGTLPAASVGKINP